MIRESCTGRNASSSAFSRWPVLPLLVSDNVVGVLALFAGEPGFFR